LLLTTRGGKCIRFALSDVRIFKGRSSTGVRGIKLAKGDAVVSLALLHHGDVSIPEARAYLKQANAVRRAATGEEMEETPIEDSEENGEEAILSPERYAHLAAAEQFVLAVSASGFGKRTSSYEYRLTGRGGSGIVAMGMARKNNAIVAAFPVEESDDIMLITDQGQTIRSPVASIRIAGRAAQGVTLFRLESGERVVSVERIEETSADSA
jgi:DNA gyrase subunit A